MLLRLFSNLVTIAVYLVAIPVAIFALGYHLTRWMVKHIAREWRS